MSVFDLLTAEDKEAIDRYISNYGDYGGMYLGNHANIEKLLRFWDGAKSGFLATMMGNQLILERRISISTPESILWGNIEHSIYPSGDGIPFIKNYFRWLNGKDYSLYECLSELVSIECLVTNIYSGDSFEIPIPGKKHSLQVNKGCKTAKILGKIASTFHIEGYEDFRLKQSMALNQKKFDGTLCLSIHPLDYMTMSDNDCNWDSCMSWQKPGEYREGTVEMMNSPYVIVAYLKAEKDFDVFGDGEFMWGNKRWRELFVVSPDVITGIKGYPYDDSILEREVFKWLMELAATNCSWCNYQGPITYEVGEPFDFCNSHVGIYYRFKIMYDDFYGKNTGYFTPAILDKLDAHGLYEMVLSGENVCMYCGEVASTINWDTQSLLCPSCTGEVKCDKCGDFISTDNAFMLHDNVYVCPYCTDNYVRNCAYCEEAEYAEDMTPVYINHEDGVLLDEKIHLCDCCWEDKDRMNNYFGRIAQYPVRRRYFYPLHVSAIDSEELTLDGFMAFGYYAETVEKARELL